MFYSIHFLILGGKTKKSILIWILVIILIVINGCSQSSGLKEIVKENEKVIAKPIIDYGEIESTILNIDEGTGIVKLRINKIIKYSHDERASYPSLKMDDELNVKFNWGIKATKIDVLPIGESEGDIILSGVKEGDIIKGEINNEYGWRVYEYEVLN